MDKKTDTITVSIKNTTDKELSIDLCSPSTFKQDGLKVNAEWYDRDCIDLLFDLTNNQIKISLIRIQSTACFNAFMYPIYYKIHSNDGHGGLREDMYPIYPLSYMSVFQEQQGIIDIPIDIYLSNETGLIFKINPHQSITVTCFISEIGKLKIDKKFTLPSIGIPVMIKNKGNQKQGVTIFSLDRDNLRGKELHVEKSLVNSVSYLMACSQLKEQGFDFNHILIYSDNTKNFDQKITIGGVESAILSDYRQPYQEQSNLISIQEVGGLKITTENYSIKMEIEAKSTVLIYLMTGNNNKFSLNNSEN